jgi:hypothetical protein
VSPLRALSLVLAALALAGALAIGEPEVFSLLLLAAVVLFVVGAGSIAADAFPLRSRLALTCSVLTPVAAIGLAMAAFAGVPPVVAALPPLVLALTPVIAGRLRLG